MNKLLNISLIGCAVLFNLFGGPLDASAQARGVADRTPENRLEKAAAGVIAATLNYRSALERVLVIYEREAARRAELAELRLDLYERGVLSKREFEDAQKAQAAAQNDLEETRRTLADTDRMLAEARIAEALARLAPLARGRYEETPGLARYNGSSAWSLLQGTSQLREFFLARFGRVLPISAFGQTSLHDRLGFDHRNALDIAVHPDSPEGRALMEHLRTLGIPFIAAWGAIPGSASGAHIHVGQPSPRLTGSR